MREGALPSPANQARVIQDVLNLAVREKFNVNIIEAYDQPWKRRLEGAVGGYWGLLDDGARAFKFRWGVAVSNHPDWRRNAVLGIVLAAAVFAAAWTARHGASSVPASATWLAIATIASVSGVFIGWAASNVAVESFNVGGWIKSISLLAIAAAAPVAAAAACMTRRGLPAFAEIVGPARMRTRDPLAIALGVVLIGVVILAVQSALGLVFDPRYRDFPFAPLTGALAPLLLVSVMSKPAAGARPAAEIAAAAVLGASAVYIVLNEGVTNWQAVWFCATLAMLAIILLRVRVVRG
jgi:glucan 1,3-beta-glucosidase